jgi:hypothetical protein
LRPSQAASCGTSVCLGGDKTLGAGEPRGEPEVISRNFREGEACGGGSAVA